MNLSTGTWWSMSLNSSGENVFRDVTLSLKPLSSSRQQSIEIHFVGLLGSFKLPSSAFLMSATPGMRSSSREEIRPSFMVY